MARSAQRSAQTSAGLLRFGDKVVIVDHDSIQIAVAQDGIVTLGLPKTSWQCRATSWLTVWHPTVGIRSFGQTRSGGWRDAGVGKVSYAAWMGPEAALVANCGIFGRRFLFEACFKQLVFGSVPELR